MANEAIVRIQQALASKGFDPGGADGIWGRKTTAALRKFQAAAGLEPDGIAGPLTMAALLPGVPAPVKNTGAVLPWFDEAKRLIGIAELRGDADNPTIMDWAADLDLNYAGDEVPWCGLFVAHCIASTLSDEPLPANPLGARQWERFGEKTGPRVGAVLVFWRESLASGKGHVGFYNAETADAYQVLGGNQGDKVCLAWIAKDRCRGAFWPVTAKSLTSGPIVRASREGGLSTNEA